MFTFIKFNVGLRFEMFVFVLSFDIFKTFFTLVIHLGVKINMQKQLLIFCHKMNKKTIRLEEYVNFVDNTMKQNKNFKVFKFSITIIIVLFFFFCFF